MGRLQKKLDVIKKNFEAKVSADVREVMHRATRDLVASGQAEAARGEGDVAPAFSLPGITGEVISSRDLREKGPLVLTFFRGHW